MTFVLRHLLFAVPALLLLGAGAATAEWRPEQRSSFMDDCISACKENPKIRPDQRPLCASACGCVVSEGEKFMTATDFETTSAALAQGKSTPHMDRISSSTIPMCNRRTFGP